MNNNNLNMKKQFLKVLLIAAFVASYQIALAQNSEAVGNLPQQQLNSQTGKLEDHKFARPVALPDGQKTMAVPIYKGDDGMYYADSTKCGNCKETDTCLLMAGTWYQTEDEEHGNIIYGKKTIVFDGYKINNVKIFNFGYRDTLQSKVIPLKASLICKTHITPEAKEEKPSSEWLLYVQVKEGKEFHIIYNDSLISDNKFKTGDTIPLSEEITNILNLPRDPDSIHRQLSTPIQVVCYGYMGCFIDEFSYQQIVEPATESASGAIPLWLWIVGGVGGVIVALVIWFIIHRKRSIKKDRKDSDNTGNTPSKEKFKIKGSDGSEYDSIEELARKLNVKAEKIEKKLQKKEKYTYNKIEYSKNIKGMEWKPVGENEVVGNELEDIDTLKKELEAYKKKKKNLEDEKNKLEKQVDTLNDIVEQIKNNPKSFKDDKEFTKLAKLINDSEKVDSIKKELLEDPSKIDTKTPVGLLVVKGQFFEKISQTPDLIINNSNYSATALAIQVKRGKLLDNAKDNVDLITQDASLKDTLLWQYIEFVNDPAKISSATSNKIQSTSLFKLVKGLDYLSQNSEKMIDTNVLTSDILKDRLGKIIVASNGSLQYNDYRSYWKNVSTPLQAILNNLYKHDEKYNTRALIFYASQLYSIACVMCEASGEIPPTSTGRLKKNVQLFTSGNNQVGQYGFPEMDSATLQSCKFEYKGADGEDDKVKYLKQYGPLPFILLQSYYSDDILK